MKKISHYIISLILLLTPIISFADCKYNEQWVPTGTKAGGYTCQADGKWK